MNKNLHNCVDLLKHERLIKVVGFNGFWSVIDDLEGYVLLEHNTHGDETCYVVARASDFEWRQIRLRNNEVVNVPYFSLNSRIYETFDDIRTCLEDECIL